jgi:hypothetical protein
MLGRTAQVDAPIEREDGSPRIRCEVDDMPAILDVEDERSRGLTDRRGDTTMGGLDEALVGRSVEQPGPGIEELDGFGPGLDLGPEVADRQVGQLLEQEVDLLGPRLEPLLQDREILRAAALDQVGRQGKGRAGEAEQRDLGASRGRRAGRRRISKTCGTLSRGSGTRSASICASSRIGFARTGPGAKSTSMPIPGIGVKMSWNRITASEPTSSMGWSETFTDRSTSQHISRNETPSRTAR